MGITKCDQRCFLCEYKDCILTDDDIYSICKKEGKEYKSSTKDRARAIAYYYEHKEKCKQYAREHRKELYERNREKEIAYSKERKMLKKKGLL